MEIPKFKRKTLDEWYQIDEFLLSKLEVKDQAHLMGLAIEQIAGDAEAPMVYYREEAEKTQRKTKQLNEEIRRRTRTLKERDTAKYIDVQIKRFKDKPIAAVRITKSKDEVEMRLHIVREVKNLFNESALFSEIRSEYGYSEWVEIMKCISTSKSKLKDDLWKHMMQLFRKMDSLGVIEPLYRFNENDVLRKKGNMREPPQFQKDQIHVAKLRLNFENFQPDTTLPEGLDPLPWCIVTRLEE